MIRVCLHGSCYLTNIGNAFVNGGALACIKQALQSDGKVFQIGDYSDFLFSRRNALDKSFSFLKYLDVDYFVNSGMNICRDHFIRYLPLYKKLALRGVKIIFLGSGAGLYTPEEVCLVRHAMRKVPIYALITRDSYTYKHYSDLAYNVYDGVDCGLFTPDTFTPLPFIHKPFNIMAFDHFKPPRINHKNNSTVYLSHDLMKHYSHRLDVKPPTLISDLPSDYLNLYARAEITYSDRVHACIPALSFGNSARMYFKTGDRRLFMFHRLGATDIYKRPVSLDMIRLAQAKQNQVKVLRRILLKGLNIERLAPLKGNPPYNFPFKPKRRLKTVKTTLEHLRQETLPTLKRIVKGVLRV